MRKVIVSNLISLDGFMAGPAGEIDWFIVNDEFFEYARELLTKVDTLLFGRVTYEGMLSYWTTPAAIADDPAIANGMNSLPKIVFSRTLDQVEWGEWNNATLVKGDLVEAVTKLKQQPGGDMVIYGSGSIVATLTQAGLIDEYQIIISPVFLGSGKPLFDGIASAAHPLKLKPASTPTRLFKNGGMVLYYQPA